MHPRSSHPWSLILLALGVALLLAQPVIGFTPKSPRSPAPGTLPDAGVSDARRAAIASGYGQLPLAFEVNVGQDADPAVRFVARGGGYTLALTSSAALLSLAHQSLAAPARMPFALPGQPAITPPLASPLTLLSIAWLGANLHPLVTGEQPLPGTVNYFIGNDPKQWHTNLPTYQQVRLHDVYPGVDLVYYGQQGQLEYDFVVAPGADPARIALGFSGAQRVGVDLAGNLRLSLPGGVLQQDKPSIYQAVNGARRTVVGGFTLAHVGHVGFALGAYNPRLPLVIDPAYKFSTYLGGSGWDSGYGIAIDTAGNAYMVGTTGSTNFPTASPPQASFGGGTYDAFVTKLNAAGTALVYSTYLGGSANDSGNGIAVDAYGDAYITGTTSSTNFPLVGALENTFGGGSSDAFVTLVDATGSYLAFSTYLGGFNTDYGYGIAVGAFGDMYVTGVTQINTITNDDNFPATPGAFQTNFQGGVEDAFVTKIHWYPSHIYLAYSTYLGGSGDDEGHAIAVDAGGNAYVTGLTFSANFPVTVGAPQSGNGGYDDAFVTKLNAAGSGLVLSTYLGGNGDDIGYGIALYFGAAVVTGATSSTNFPTTAGALQTSLGGSGNFNAFISEILPPSSLVYSTYLGGNNNDAGEGIAVDSHGNAYVTGGTSSSNFPLANPLQSGLRNSAGDGFVSKLNPSGSALLFSTYLGGSGDGVSGDIGNGIAVGPSGVMEPWATVYITGGTPSFDFPIVNALNPAFGGGGGDSFVTKIATQPSVDTTTGVFRPSNGTLYLKNSNTTGPADIALAYGLPGDKPVTGDWTGQGYKSIGIYRNGTFYLRNSNTTGNADLVVPFGTSGDIPVAGDWTGKGYDSIGVYRPSISTFFLRDTNSAGPPDHVVTLGISGDVPIVGDWTAKGWDSVGVFRPSNGIVYLRNSNTTGFADINFVYGIAGDKPVVGDWDANGTDTIGIDRNGVFYLRNSNTTGPADLVFALGVSGDVPIAGPWILPPGSEPPRRSSAAPVSGSAAARPSLRRR